MHPRLSYLGTSNPQKLYAVYKTNSVISIREINPSTGQPIGPQQQVINTVPHYDKIAIQQASDGSLTSIYHPSDNTMTIVTLHHDYAYRCSNTFSNVYQYLHTWVGSGLITYKVISNTGFYVKTYQKTYKILNFLSFLGNLQWIRNTNARNRCRFMYNFKENNPNISPYYQLPTKPSLLLPHRPRKPKNKRINHLQQPNVPPTILNKPHPQYT